MAKKRTGDDKPLKVEVSCPHLLTVNIQDERGNDLTGFEATYHIHGGNQTEWHPVPYAQKHPETNVTSWVTVRSKPNTWLYQGKLTSGLMSDQVVVFVIKKCAEDDILPAPEPTAQP